MINNGVPQCCVVESLFSVDWLLGLSWLRSHIGHGEHAGVTACAALSVELPKT